MESTGGHLLGTLYTLLIMLQGSLFFTRVHLNKWWMFTQEALVLVHGTMVAYLDNIRQPELPSVWRMFFFGFAALIVVTQMYGLGLKRWQRWSVIAAFVIGIGVAYNGDWTSLNEVLAHTGRRIFVSLCPGGNYLAWSIGSRVCLRLETWVLFRPISLTCIKYH